MFGQLGAVEAVGRLIKGHEKGIYTDMEVRGALIGLAADHPPRELAEAMPQKWIDQVRQATAEPPETTELIFAIETVVVRAGTDLEARSAERRRIVFEGNWNWHRYFAGLSGASSNR